MNKVIICILCAGLNGCFLTKTEYVKVSYPIVVCPAPPKTQRPDLYINKLTDADIANYGKVAKYYEISLQQLFGYIDTLEVVIEGYKSTSRHYEDLANDADAINIEGTESNETE